MLYDVKVLSPQGQIKKIVSSQELAKMHWKAFYTAEEGKSLNTSILKPVSGSVKKKLDLLYGPLH